VRTLPTEFNETNSNVKFAELFEITLLIGKTYYFTNHNDDIVWGGREYVALPIQRSAINQHSNLETDTVELKLSNITGDLVSEVQKNMLEGATITIKRIAFDGDAGTGSFLILFVGTASSEYNRQTLVLKCRSILDSLNITVPRRLYQEPCNNSLFDENCGLTQSDYKYEAETTLASTNDYTLTDSSFPVYKVPFNNGDSSNPVEVGDTITGGDSGYTAKVVCITYITDSTGYIWYLELSNANNFDDNEVLTGGGNTVVVNGTPAEDTSFYELGEVELTSGDYSGLRFMIRAAKDDSIYLAIPMPENAESGLSFNVYPGCDKRPSTCKEKFGNVERFSGFIYIPRPEEVLL